jgi:hypothetical protein
MAEDGPACGSEEASTYLLAVYLDDEGIHFIDQWYCCHRHVPHPAGLIPEGAQIIETVIADARYTTIAGDGPGNGVMTFESGGRTRQS